MKNKLLEFDSETNMEPDRKTRLAAEFIDLGINGVISLCRVNYLQSRPPISIHTHKDCFEITYHETGSQVYNVNGENFHLKGGEFFVVYPNEIHSSGDHFEEKSRFYYLIFDISKDIESFLGLEERETDIIREALFSIKQRQFHGTEHFGNILKEILKLFYSDHPLKRMRIISLFEEFFFRLIETEKRSDKDYIPEDAYMLAARDYIERNVEETHSIESLAKIARLSESRFKQKFKKYFGIPPIEYSLKIKIEASMKLLAETDLTMTEIAYRFGFCSSQYFSTVFKKLNGVSPLNYRKTWKK